MSQSTGGGDPLLSDLCTICHTNPPKYRCPRCFIRTCSLPCTRRHKTWSQCSGVRDPAAYLRRNELANPSAFDRDFNFITGIERSVERAGRDAEVKGVQIDHSQGDEEGDRKRRKTSNDAAGGAGGLVKGEAGFLRGVQNGEVNVIRAPRGMTRNKQNNSRWHPKQKCLIWTTEWIAPDRERKIRTCLESCRVAEAYDRFYPLPKEERRKDEDQGQEEQQRQDPKQKENETLDQKQEQKQDETPEQAQEHKYEDQTLQQNQEPQPQPEQPDAQPSVQQPSAQEPPESQTHPNDITPHRAVYFYLHRPRTAIKQPVLIPLSPSITFTTALRGRTVLEFPTVYILPYSPESLRAASVDKDSTRFILEEEYLQSGRAGEESNGGPVDGEDAHENRPGPDSVDLEQVDESQVMEILQQDLFEPVPAAASE